MPRGVFPRRKHERHGQQHTLTYKSWSNAISRCYNKNCPKYSFYGGRGIRMHAAWRDSFIAFLSDVGERPSSRHTLDRYPDPNGGYAPGNVRWATSLEQRRSRNGGCKITYTAAKEIRALKGKVTQNELSVRYGVSRSAVSAIQLGRIYAEEYRGER